MEVDQNIENVVTQLHSMSANPATASQVPMVLGEARKVGLEIDLNGRRWRHSDGRSGKTEPFLIETPAGGAANGKAAILDDKSLATALSNLVQLQRSGDQVEVQKMVAPPRPSA